MNIYLIRHGETDWNKQGKIQGHMDIALNQQGRLQAKILASKFKNIKIDRIYTSDLLRASQTAEIINKTTKSLLIADERLRERNYGDWQNYSWSEVHSQNPNLKEEWRTNPVHSRPPKGESLHDLYNRITRFLSELISEAKNNILIVAHNSPLKILISIAKGITLEEFHTIDHLSNTEIIQIKSTEGNLSINEEEYNKISLNKTKLAFQNQIV
ncbi:2,3-bisphosphoglycerate-dependent phosphoglycerate mutase [Candidatus Lokiarchaeum ossiferum]|uniref:phosphoglycerate mutase (2,3-diphosphoglycerate-dependent) n=1 Tax=Candidatus Lokiarchaeum ossiferum TaxID=2951803 RepID=A0ABY6HVQ2_9ARCH|nr:2,3-bisphosphoglycerate-dependent phosphoglycerate mutase [Candidatus Lokiarchaeum sp. B-35]